MADLQRDWKPNVTVAALVERDGRYLLVEEHTAEGLRINQPAGHLDPGESLIDAARREALEETGCVVEPTALVGIYQWPLPGSELSYLRFAFAADLQRIETGRQLDEGIVQALWLTPDELRACRERHRSPLVWQCVEDHLAGKHHPLELIRYYG